MIASWQNFDKLVIASTKIISNVIKVDQNQIKWYKPTLNQKKRDLSYTPHEAHMPQGKLKIGTPTTSN